MYRETSEKNFLFFLNNSPTNMFEKTLHLLKRALNFNFTGLGPRNITKRLAVGKSLLCL